MRNKGHIVKNTVKCIALASAILAGAHGLTLRTIELVLFACILCHLSLTDIDGNRAGKGGRINDAE